MAVRKRTKEDVVDGSMDPAVIAQLRRSIEAVNLDHPQPPKGDLTRNQLMEIVGDGAIEVARKHKLKGAHPGQMELNFSKENDMAEAKKKVVKKKASDAKPAAKKAAAAPATESKKSKKDEAADEGDGMVSLADLAEELGISPATARRKLRDARGGEAREDKTRLKWKEGSRELEKVRKLLAPAEE